MRKSVLALVAAAAALSLPTQAPAAAADASVQSVYDSARCIVTRDRQAALRLMQSLPIESAPADLSSLSSEAASRCLEGVADADALILRGGIAQAMFFRDFGGFGEEPSRGVALLNLNLPVQDSPPGDPAVDIYRWSDCLVRNDGPRSERLLSSRPGSQNESRAIEGLRPYMQACAPEGLEIQVDAAELRSVIAQSAYQSMYRYWTRELTSTRQP